MKLLTDSTESATIELTSAELQVIGAALWLATEGDGESLFHRFFPNGTGEGRREGDNLTDDQFHNNLWNVRRSWDDLGVRMD